ncbi:MAG: hypothetical protein IPN85_03075 [Flavobacteriales bacterium]|nr:hypothetical protein [Flavobacteriales bacterium]MBL0034180.1 hypothetical protein [Flavobacteriales bacterium]
MNTKQLSFFAAPALAFALLTGCGSDSTNTDAHNDGTTSTGTTHGSSSTTNADGTDVNATADRDRTDVATMESSEIRINGAVRGTPVYDERYAASKDIRGYRALLMAELEAIRVRLNDGTRAADVTKQDQDRAADLAQGLERMDRLIKAVEESDDMTWTSIRESQLKEAGEVRVWATGHGYKLS